METGNEEVVGLAALSENLQQKVNALAEQPFDLVAKKRQAPAAEQSPSSQPAANSSQAADGASSTASTPGATQSGHSQAPGAGTGRQQQQPDGGLKGLKAMVVKGDASGVVHHITQSLSDMGLAKQSDKAT